MIELLGIRTGCFSCDLKMVNILLGIQPVGSTYSCPYCECNSNDWNARAPLRTFGSIRENSTNWRNHDGDRANLKYYKNCEFEPIIQAEDHKLTMDVIVPPQMHIFVGITNHVWVECKKRLLALDPKDKKFLLPFEAFCKNHGITGTVNGPKRGLIGGEANKLCLLSDEVFKVLPSTAKCFATALKKLKYVQDACLGLTLFGNWRDKIREFETAYKDLHISMIDKCHILVHDVPRFLDRPNAKPLGYWTEQQFESVHADYCTTFHNFKVPRDPENPNFGPKLLGSIVHYNSNHV